jgi:gamma-glutamyltranspeptidase
VAVTSDRNAKRNFTAIDPKAVLAKVASMPVTTWNYKDDSAGTKHIGPVAQDFHAAFGLNGADDTHISIVDEGGVALAAVQGLNQELGEQSMQLQRKDREIQNLQRENQDLARKLEELKQMVEAIAARK